jgi:hypothetical protein
MAANHEQFSRKKEESSRTYEKVLPISWVDWDILDSMDFMFMDVVFTDNFGPIKKGTHFDSITVCFGDGILEIYNGFENESPLMTIDVVLTPKV